MTTEATAPGVSVQITQTDHELIARIMDSWRMEINDRAQIFIAGAAEALYGIENDRGFTLNAFPEFMRLVFIGFARQVETEEGGYAFDVIRPNGTTKRVTVMERIGARVRRDSMGFNVRFGDVQPDGSERDSTETKHLSLPTIASELTV